MLIAPNLGIVTGACDRVAVMYAGHVVERDAVRGVLTGPQHPHTKNTRELLRSTLSLTSRDGDAPGSR